MAEHSLLGPPTRLPSLPPNCDFTGRGLTKLPDLRNSGHCTELFLDQNEIAIIPSGSFAHIANLRWLYLDHNKLQAVSKSTFTGLSKLQILSLVS